MELTLSGHTHYGQIAIPRLGWSLASPFLEHAMGRHQRNGSQLYINPGTNYWGIPFRLGTPPEVTVLTLRAQNETGRLGSRPVESFGERHAAAPGGYLRASRLCFLL